MYQQISTNTDNHRPEEVLFSERAEQDVLGAIIKDNNIWDIVIQVISATDFYLIHHQLIFKAMQELINQNQPFNDPTILLNHFQQNKLTDEQTGGYEYIIELARSIASTQNVMQYVHIIKERKIKRELLEVANRIIHYIYNSKEDIANIVSRADSEIFSIASSRPQSTELLHIKNIIDKTIQIIEMNSAGSLIGLPTGFPQLDKMTSGLQAGELIVLAGRPSMGKTGFAVNILQNVLSQAITKKPVIFFSLEMPNTQIVMRILADISKIPVTRIRSGQLGGELEYERFANAAKNLASSTLYIDDSPGISPAEMRSRIRKVVRNENETPSLIVVDYLQLMRMPDFDPNNRVNEISEISRNLKAIAKEFNCPLIALSQLSRKLESRTNKRPINSDLRESGAIEQDADLIMFVYRDEYYNARTSNQGIAEIIIGKQRNGPIGKIFLEFSPETVSFIDIDENNVERIETYKNDNQEN